ncbi:MAG: hypothetical protein IKC14_08610 [Kiritimatiellae bacterium]|nr:hypothetical protein [Kiritimatiellia bacterium]
MTARHGSVLVMALWIIAILSVMVVSFAFEARQQAGIDIYVRERNRVSRIIDSGRVLGEAVLLGYKDAPDPDIKSGEPDWNDAFEEDRWVIEKYDLKTDHKCVIGPIRLDEEDPDEADEDAPTITVELKFESATSKIDINSLTDAKGLEILKTVLRDSGIDDELEVEIEDADRSGRKKHNLLNLLVASWKDWRDEDDAVSRGPFESGTDYNYNPQDDDGAEKSWYEERDEEDEIPVKDRRVPANGPIKKLEELSYIRGFRDFPSVLTGGRLYDGTEQDDTRGKRGKDEMDELENPQLAGIMDNFKVSGGMKLELNDETREKDLKTILGPMYDPEDMSATEDLNDLVQAILTALKTMPEDDDNVDETRTWWPFKDFGDLERRVDDVGFGEKVPEDLKEYIRWPGESAASSSGKSDKDKKGASEDVEKFSMTITGESLGMKYVVRARCVVEENKVKYIEWSENESTK